MSRKYQILSFLIVLSLLLFACVGCASDKDSQGPTQHYYETVRLGCSIEELTSALPVSDESAFSLLSAFGNQILYLKSDLSTDSAHVEPMKTEKIGIIDTKSGNTITEWSLDSEIICAGGVLNPDSTAVCIGKSSDETKDDTYEVLFLDGEKIDVCEIAGRYREVTRLNYEDVLVSYETTDGSIGIGKIQNNAVTGLFEGSAADGFLDLGGLLSAYSGEQRNRPTQYSYSTYCVKDSVGTLFLFMQDNSLRQFPLDPESEKLDSFCLTSWGILACLSLNEETEEACREMVLFNEKGRTELYKSDWISGARYLMRGYNSTLYVDGDWNLYTCSIRNDEFCEQPLNELLPDDLQQQPIQILQKGDFEFFLYYPIQNRLFHIIVSPAA